MDATPGTPAAAAPEPASPRVLGADPGTVIIPAPQYAPASGLGGGLILVAIHLALNFIVFGDHTNAFLQMSHQRFRAGQQLRDLLPGRFATQVREAMMEAAWWLTQAQNYLFPALALLLFILFFAKSRWLPLGYRTLLLLKLAASLGIALIWHQFLMQALLPQIYYEAWIDVAWDAALLVIFGLYIGGERAKNTFVKKPRAAPNTSAPQ